MTGKSPNAVKTCDFVMVPCPFHLLPAKHWVYVQKSTFPLSPQDSSGDDFAFSLRKCWDKQRTIFSGWFRDGHLTKDWPIRVKEIHFGILVSATREDSFPFLLYESLRGHEAWAAMAKLPSQWGD